MKKIIILGGSFESASFIIEAKKNYKVIVVDKNKYAPGFKYASQKIFESIYDYKNIIKILRNKNLKEIAGVICGGTDAPMTVYKISKFLNLKCYSYKTARLFSNKYLMKKELIKYGIRTPWFKKINNFIELKKILKIKKNLVLKPCDNRGGRGVFLINRKNENIISLYNEAKKLTKLNYLIVEEFIEGEQYSTESIILNNNNYTPGFCRRNYDDTKRFYPNIIENGGDQPVNLNQKIKKQITNLAVKAGKALGLKEGILKGDVVLSKNKKPCIIEVACRLSGGWFSSHQIPHATGVNIIKAAIDIACSQKISHKFLINKYQKSVGIRYFFPKNGRLIKITLPKKMKRKNNIIKLMFFKKIGDRIGSVESHVDRMGFVIIKEENKSKLIKELNYFVKNTKIDTV